MTPFTKLTGIAAPFLRNNIDTDLIIPGRFLKTISRVGLGAGLFYTLRRDEHGEIRPDFILNRAAFEGTAILIAGENFGCGSSREHAPWALLDYGIRCVIAPSFGDIFFSNAINCGLLPAIVSHTAASSLAASVATGGSKLTIDLERMLISGADEWKFAISFNDRTRLLEGIDPIDLSLQEIAAIEAHERRFMQNKNKNQCDKPY